MWLSLNSFSHNCSWDHHLPHSANRPQTQRGGMPLTQSPLSGLLTAHPVLCFPSQAKVLQTVLRSGRPRALLRARFSCFKAAILRHLSKAGNSYRLLLEGCIAVLPHTHGEQSRGHPILPFPGRQFRHWLWLREETGAFWSSFPVPAFSPSKAKVSWFSCLKEMQQRAAFKPNTVNSSRLSLEVVLSGPALINHPCHGSSLQLLAFTFYKQTIISQLCCYCSQSNLAS